MQNFSYILCSRHSEYEKSCISWHHSARKICWALVLS